MKKNYVWIERYTVFIRVFVLAIFNLSAIFFFSLSSIRGELNSLDALAFGFLHTMVALVMITLVHLSKKIENKS